MNSGRFFSLLISSLLLPAGAVVALTLSLSVLSNYYYKLSRHFKFLQEAWMSLTLL